MRQTQHKPCALRLVRVRRRMWNAGSHRCSRYTISLYEELAGVWAMGHELTTTRGHGVHGHTGSGLLYVGRSAASRCCCCLMMQ